MPVWMTSDSGSRSSATCISASAASKRERDARNIACHWRVGAWPGLRSIARANSASACRPVPVEPELDERQRGMSLGEALVEFERLGGGLACLANRRRDGRRPQADRDQRAAVGQPGVGERVAGIFAHRALEELLRLLQRMAGAHVREILARADTADRPWRSRCAACSVAASDRA